jgi:hypothetical protein
MDIAEPEPSLSESLTDPGTPFVEGKILNGNGETFFWTSGQLLIAERGEISQGNPV